MFLLIVKLIIAPFMLLYWRPKVYGYKNLFIKGKAILASNHLSMADPILIEIISPRLVYFMAKSELFRSTVGRIFFNALCAFPVNRQRPDVASIKSAIRILNRNKVFGIFPEGKRSVTYEMDKFERGTAFLALRADAPVIPIYIAQDSYQRGVRPRLIVGTPVSMEGLPAGSSHAVDMLTQRISDAMHDLKVQLEEKDAHYRS